MTVGRSGRTAAALLLAASAWFAGEALAADPLGRFPVDPQQVSVSGISSGAFMANQLHVAHSAGIMGAGIVAGGLFGCAVDRVSSDGVAGLATLAVGPCMSVPSLLKPIASYAQLVSDLAARGWIDPPSNLARSRVYLFTGKADSVVNSKTVELGAALYKALGVPDGQMKFRDRDLPGAGAGHSWVTRAFGNACDANASPFINRCDYDQAGEVLQTIYGPLEAPAGAPGGRLRSLRPTVAPARRAPTPVAGDRLSRTAQPSHACLAVAALLQSAARRTPGSRQRSADAGDRPCPQAHATIASLRSRTPPLNTNPNAWNWWGDVTVPDHGVRSSDLVDAA